MTPEEWNATTCPLLRLPQELLDEVVSYIMKEREFAKSINIGEIGQTIPTILSLCRTSKRLYQTSVLHLYQNISIKSNKFVLLARTLKKEPQLANRTRELKMIFDGSYTPSQADFKMHPDALLLHPSALWLCSDALRDGLRTRYMAYWKHMASRKEVFVDSLAVMLIKLVPRLQTLRLSKNPRRLYGWQTLQGVLKGLKSLHISESGPPGETYQFDSSDAELLRTMSPNLEVLNLDRIGTTATALLNAPKSLRHLEYHMDAGPSGNIRPWASADLLMTPTVTQTLPITTCTMTIDTDLSKNPWWAKRIENIAIFAPYLTTLILQLQSKATPYLSHPRKLLEDLLAPLRHTLRTLGVEMLGTGRYIAFLAVGSLAKFKRLEHLSLPTIFIKEYKARFFSTIPSSLRSLDLFKERGFQEMMLAGTVKNTRYRLPNLEALTIRVYENDSKPLPRLEQECEKVGIKFSFHVLGF